MQNTLFGTQNTVFVNQVTQYTLFYGVYGEDWKNHNIRTWKTWSWVSSRLKKVHIGPEGVLNWKKTIFFVDAKRSQIAQEFQKHKS